MYGQCLHFEEIHPVNGLLLAVSAHYAEIGECILTSHTSVYKKTHNQFNLITGGSVPHAG